jgi:hypothetical protein
VGSGDLTGPGIVVPLPPGGLRRASPAGGRDLIGC